MEKKIILILVVLLFAAGIVFAENNTTQTVEIEDNANYILPVSITNEGIKFDDGFTGFCIDPAKDSITAADRFTLGVLGDGEIENNIKLAIIECYKQDKQDVMADILSQIDDKDSNNKVLGEVFKSNEKIGDKAVVNINNSTEATFEFEFLKSTDDAKSDCVAYKVSMKTIKTEDALTATNEDADNATSPDSTANNAKTDSKNTAQNTAQTDNAKKATQNNNQKTAQNTTQPNNAKKAEQNNTGNNTTNEINKTIVNKTNTVIVNENNTTIINHNNVKTVNDSDDEPQNDTAAEILKKAGNPIFLLIIVIVIIAIAVVVMRRKD